MDSIFEKVLDKAKQKRRRIGITIFRTDDEIISSLKKAQDLAEVIIYGKKIDGFDCVEMEPEGKLQENIGRKIVQDFKAGKIDQFVRGQVDDFGVVEEFKQQYGIPKEEKRVCFGLMQDVFGRETFMTIISNPEGQDMADKKRIVDPTAEWLQNQFGMKPKIAVMASCRPGTYGKDPAMSKTYDEAEELVKYYTDKGYEAKNVHIELEKAMGWANILVPANGAIGNQIFRTLLYLGNGKNLASPTLFPGKGIYEDDSRNEKDWYPHIAAASAWAAK